MPAGRAGDGYIENIDRRDDGRFDVTVQHDDGTGFTETVDHDSMLEYVRTAFNRFVFRVIEGGRQ